MARRLRPGRPKLHRKKRIDFSTRVSPESKKYIDEQQKRLDWIPQGKLLDMMIETLIEHDIELNYEEEEEEEEEEED